MGRILALDIGDRRIGVAVSDPMGIIASPYTVIDRKYTPDYLTEISKIVINRSIEKLVVGMPLNMKGQASAQTEKVSKMILDLKSYFDLPVISIDERLSSISAEKSLQQQGVKTGHNKGDIDKTAAAIFLQEYLDSV